MTNEQKKQEKEAPKPPMLDIGGGRMVEVNENILRDLSAALSSTDFQIRRLKNEKEALKNEIESLKIRVSMKTDEIEAAEIQKAGAEQLFLKQTKDYQKYQEEMKKTKK